MIARYGGSWRGIKPKVAAEHGAVGCLIYSDPQDDGYVEGDVFPDGADAQRERRAARQRDGHAGLARRSADARRGGASRGAQRLDVRHAPTLTTIPVLPLSYGDAQPLLAAIAGDTAPDDWRGGLPITYHLGPGPARVHMVVRFDWSLRRLYDVIAEHPRQRVSR